VQVLAELAECFVNRGRSVAALVCVDEARSLGIPEARLEATREQALEKVGPRYAKFRELVPLTASKA
jgi:hypothetical protein